jgi:predicted PurR-regulated permease PerM
MLGIDARAARYTWTAAIVVFVLGFIYLIRRTLFVFVLALLFAHLVAPLVDLLDRFLPGRRTRTLALALSYAIFIAVVVVLGIQISSRVAAQASSLATKLPQMIDQWEHSVSLGSPLLDSIKQRVLETLQQEIQTRANDLLSALPRASSEFVSIASNLIYVVIIPILAFFFLKDANLARQQILELVSETRRRLLVEELLADVHLLLSHYMRALVLITIVTFTAYSTFFSIIGVPYAVLLGALSGVLEFIPIVGPAVAGLTVLIVAFLAGTHALAVLIYVSLYRVFLDYIVSPRIMGQGVELHPLIVLFGVFAGAEIAGVPGAFLSVPAMALARVLYRRTEMALRARQIVAPPSVR